MKKYFSLFLLTFLFTAVSALAQTKKPNVIVILSDDQGWGDVGFNGCKEIPTPNLDGIAASGVRFSSGYASHSYCSPSRAGLLTGKYQQRFGHECNIPYNVDIDDETIGLSLDETMMSNVFQDNGYKTACIGKWHLGDNKNYWPNKRGFDYWYGFFGGGMSFWGDTKKSEIHGVLRNGKVVPRTELTHLTDDFTTEAVNFVERNKKDPFFMYLAYNAPHAPDHATAEHLKLTEHIEYGGRAVYGAMVAGMDQGIGKLIDKLKAEGLYENTIIVFYSDNGGRAEHARNYPFRGHKGMLFEGGIRVPFCISWPSSIDPGKTYDNAITGLDVFPTVLAAANIAPKKDLHLDGVNLLPYLKGHKEGKPHKTLYWRYSGGKGYAVRHQNMKLVHSLFKERTFLFDLNSDPWERNDLASQQPEKVKELEAMYQKWSAELEQPRWNDPHGANVHKEEGRRQAFIDRASKGEKKK